MTKEFFLNEAPDQDEETSLATVEPDSITQEILRTESEDIENRISSPAEESMDYKSDIETLSTAKKEPLDYTSDIDLDVPCDKNYIRQESIADNQDCNKINGNNYWL